jgi:aminoglycoside phosphotransferase (APT) family kinase protein
VTRDGRSLRREAAIQAAVADSGFPAPAVLGLSADGTRMLMERVDGPSLLDALLTGAIDPAAGGELLGGLHRRLHELAAPDVLDVVGPGDAFLHLDLHPANVLLSPGGPVVIDWPNAAAGPPGLDVADAYLVMASIDVGDDVAPVQAALVAAFLESAGAPDVRAWFPAVIERRARDPHFDSGWVDRMRAVAAS